MNIDIWSYIISSLDIKTISVSIISVSKLFSLIPINISKLDCINQLIIEYHRKRELVRSSTNYNKPVHMHLWMICLARTIPNTLNVMLVHKMLVKLSDDLLLNFFKPKPYFITTRNHNTLLIY